MGPLSGLSPDPLDPLGTLVQIQIHGSVLIEPMEDLFLELIQNDGKVSRSFATIQPISDHFFSRILYP